MGNAARIIAVILLSSLSTTGCGGQPPSFITKRGMAVYNESGLCNEQRVQEWEDEAVAFWGTVYYIDPVEDIGIELHCVEQDLFHLPIRQPNGVVEDDTTDAYQWHNEIYLSPATSYARFFLHESTHWALVYYSDVPNDNNIHHILFRALGISN